MTKSFLEADDRTLTISDSNVAVFGNTGIQVLNLKSSATNIKVDSNIEKIYFDNPLSFYKFQQLGNELKIFDVSNTLITQIGMRDDGTALTFANGTINALIFGDATGVHVSVGGVLVNDTIATALTTPTINSAIASSPAFTLTSTADGVPTQEGKTITFTVTPNTAITQTTQLNLDIVGQALNSIVATTSANDFSAAGSMLFNVGDTAAKQVTVTVNNDSLSEGMEAYKARLVDTTGNEKSSVVGTIIDGVPVLNLLANASSVNEGSSVIFNVTSDVPAPTGGFVIPYQLSGSATNTVDYVITPATGTITIPAGEKTGVLTFTANSDTTVEAPETIVVSLSSVGNATINTNIATTTINDTSVVLEANKFFFSGSASVNEGGKAIYTISHTPVTSAITIPYTITGSATNGSDYTNSGTSPITFNIGDSSKTIELPITADVTTEGNETVIVTLGTPSSDTVATGQNTITTTIVDTSVTGTSNNFKLTTAIETITGTDGNDLITAYIDASGITDTLNTSDVINGGNGSDTLLITTNGADAGAFPVATITGIETVSIQETGGVAGSYDLNSVFNETTVINNKSSDDVNFTNIATGAKLVVAGDGTSVNGNTIFTMSSSIDTIDLTFNGGVTGGNVTRNATGAAAITINSTGAANVVDTLDLDTAKALTALTINASTSLTATLAADYAANSTLTVTGAGAKVDLSGAALSAAISNVNASALTGSVLLQVNQADKIVDTKFIGGTGNDTLDIGKVKYNSTTLTANGADGVDTLKISDQDTLSATTVKNITNFERLEIYDDNDGNVDTFDASLLKGITTVQIDADSAGDGYNLTNLSASQAMNIVIAGNQTVAPSLNISNATVIGNIDTLGLAIDAGVSGNAVTVAGINAPGIEFIDLNAIDSFTATTLTGLAALATLTISGSGDVNLTTDKLPLNLNSTIDASSSTGMITVNASAATTNGMSIKGSLSQANVLTGTEQADVLTGGAGADSLTGGGGADTLNGGTNTDTLVGGAGSDVLNGGIGADVLNGGAGIDTLNGGSGDDLFSYAVTTDLFDKNALVDSIAGGSGANGLLLGTTGTAFAIAATDIWTRASGIESLTCVANTTANTLVLDVSAETQGVKLIDLSSNSAATGNIINVSSFTSTNTSLMGSATGATSIVGGAGNDTITGGTGNDTIVAGNGADVIYGGTGDDSINLAISTTVGTTTTTAADTYSDQIYLPSQSNSYSITGLSALDTISLTQSAFGSISLTDGTTYSETTLTLSTTAQDFGTNGSAGIIAIGAATGTGGVKLYYTSDIGAATTTNSQLFLTLVGVATDVISTANLLMV